MADGYVGRSWLQRVRYRQEGGHVHARMFCGLVHVAPGSRPEDYSLGLSGTLTFRVEEWPLAADGLARSGWQLIEETSELRGPLLPETSA